MSQVTHEGLIHKLDGLDDPLVDRIGGDVGESLERSDGYLRVRGIVAEANAAQLAAIVVSVLT
jgi:hypothetical protein